MPTAEQFLEFVGKKKDTYTFRELQIELAGDRGRAVPRSTLQRWMEVCGMPISRPFYRQDQLQKLRALALFMNTKGATYKAFKAKWNELIAELYKEKNSDEGQFVRTVETECIRV